MSGFGVIIEWLRSFWNVVKTGFTWILDGLILLIQYVVYLIFDGLCMVVEGFFQALDFSAIAFNYSAAWAGLPDQVIWIITVIGLPQGISLLGGAYAIRLLLNLIPAAFTRV